MKILIAKRNVLLSVSAFAVAGLLASTTISKSSNARPGDLVGREKKIVQSCNNTELSHVCIMKTIFGLDTSQDGSSFNGFETPEKVDAAIRKGLEMDQQSAKQ
jgi:hypothetical protein